MRIENIAGVNHGLSPERQAESRQTLRDQHAQARIVDSEPALERIDRKNRRLGRQAVHGLDAGTGLQIGGNLGKERLENIVLKNSFGSEIAADEIRWPLPNEYPADVLKIPLRRRL